MWIAKEAEIRKKEILDAALDLFMESGYDNTSVNDIIQRVGVTKGSFYYHFKSKEEVLDAISLQQAQELVGVFLRTAVEAPGNSLDKINRIISDMQHYRAEHKEKRMKIYQVLDKTENLKLKQKVYERYMELSRPPVTELIEQGVREGIFKTAHPQELAEFYIHFSITINSRLNELILSLGDNPENMEAIRNKAYFYEELLGKMFGMKEGSIRFAEAVLKDRIWDSSPEHT